MAELLNKQLPITKTGYQFQSETELEEAKWLIDEGTYKDLDDFGAAMQLTNRRLQAMLAGKRTKKRA